MENKENFDEYWEKHSLDYIEYAKSVALQDFNELSKIRLGKLVASISIDTDDDFYFENGTSYKIYGNNKKEILKNSITFLQELKIQHGSQSKWDWLRNEAIQKLREGEINFSFGGNQQMDFYVSENNPRVQVKHKI